jgi:hypothetical protein
MAGEFEMTTCLIPKSFAYFIRKGVMVSLAIYKTKWRFSTYHSLFQAHLSAGGHVTRVTSALVIIKVLIRKSSHSRGIRQHIYWKVIFLKKLNFKKINYFLIFDSIIKNKLENTFQYLIIS